MTKTYTGTHHTLTEDDFFARFKPVANPIDPSRAFDGCMFETFGEELAHVQAQARNLVWTVLDGDGRLSIESGFHFVNRLGYLIAGVPTEPDHAYSVALTEPSAPNPADSISIVWHIDDVADVRPDLTPDQCREVLAQAQRRHDAELGINWDVLEIHADDLFPQEGGAP